MKFKEECNNIELPIFNIATNEDIDNAVEWLNETLKRVAKTAKKPRNTQELNWDPKQDQWQRLINEGDHRAIWKAINWNGDLRNRSDDDSPNDEEFKRHFEKLLNPELQPNIEIDTTDCPRIPALDDPFGPEETRRAIQAVKKNRAYNGIAVGILQWTGPTLLDFITQMLSVIFTNAMHPSTWNYSQLVILFKSGIRNCCGNYRGICIMDTLAKVYDTLINRRLTEWISTSLDKAQAGGQKGRGCIEQILTVRLLIDYAKSKKVKLYLLFVDFKKAYDKIPRRKLMENLKRHGCGATMLAAIQNLYKDTKFILNSTTIDTNIGVKQGAPTSSLLFITYINDMIEQIKRDSEEDGYLGKMHSLLLMDDTVILATSRARCKQKMKSLMNFCEESGMELNESKTKFMVINGDDEDRSPLTVDGTKISHCSEYLYLGANFTSDGSMSSVMNKQVDKSMKHLHKFAMFTMKNRNMPFPLKHHVLNAALMAAILYASESWLTKDLSKMEKVYTTAYKYLLGVRQTTPIALVLVEVGATDLKSIVRLKQQTFMRKFRQISTGDEPLATALRICEEANTAMYRMLVDAENAPDPKHGLEQLKLCIRERARNATKFDTYLNMNPNLDVHPVYHDIKIPDRARLSFTRLRVSAHRLRIETGRWQRLPRDERTCSCDSRAIQDEQHVIALCPQTQHLRNAYGIEAPTLTELFRECDSVTLCYFINDCLEIY